MWAAGLQSCWSCMAAGLWRCQTAQVCAHQLQPCAVLVDAFNEAFEVQQRPYVAGAVFNQKGLDIRALKRHLKAAPPFGGHLTSFPGGAPRVQLMLLADFSCCSAWPGLAGSTGGFCRQHSAGARSGPGLGNTFLIIELLVRSLGYHALQVYRVLQIMCWWCRA